MANPTNYAILPKKHRARKTKSLFKSSWK